jgi:spermidine synthase
MSIPLNGATLPSGEACEDRFNITQLKELEDPAYYAVHHLSVLCYMLQHNAYSREGWMAVRDLLLQFVHRDLTPAMARQQNRVRLDNGHRTWSITKGAKLPGVKATAWTFTIAGVRLDTAEVYCADVRRWAESIVEDSEPLIRNLDTAR